MLDPARDEPGCGLGTIEAWWGRVFADGDVGGNHTVVVLPGASVVSPAKVAARLAIPDTGFVTCADKEVVLRTFSPVEELNQCLQVSLAAVTALGVPEGVWCAVRHERGERLSVMREASLTWARHAVAKPPRLEPVAWPTFVAADPAAGQEPVIIRQARSRIHLRCAEADHVEAVEVVPRDVLRLCAENETFGVVLSAPAGEGRQRVRVFTTSLAGKEDSATGGAVLGVGLLAAQDGARGDIRVVQGPPEPARQGHLRLRIENETGVLLGGEVTSLMTGKLAAL